MKHAIHQRLVKLAVALSLVLPSSAPAWALDEITVAYFLEWPTPNQIAQLEKIYDREMGLKVNWKSFGNGNDMNSAMASGDVQIAYSQGFVPFILGTSRGLAVKTVGVAVSYAEADNCVVSDRNPLDRSSKASIAASLKGKKVATPIGNTTHYKFLKTIEHFGLSSDDVTVVPVSGGNDAAAAFLTGQVDIGCAFGGPVDKMKEQGQVIMTGAEQEAVGILTFDVIAVTDEFAAEHPDLLIKFMEITEDTNDRFAKNKSPHWDTLAKASGLPVETVKGYLDDGGTFAFPTRQEQLSAAWMGGTVQRIGKGMADFFAAQKILPSALDSYDAVIDNSYLKKIQ